MTLTSKLDAILAQCREVLEPCEAAYIQTHGERDAIMSRLTLTPRLARATITAIEALRSANTHGSEPWLDSDLNRILQHIADEWEVSP